jgi:hypothetical protein
MSSFGADSRRRNGLKEWNCCVKLRTPMIPLPRDFQDFLRLLNANAIRYVVVGGYAVAYHGYVRYTGDLDVFVELSANNAAKLGDLFHSTAPVDPEQAR